MFPSQRNFLSNRLSNALSMEATPTLDVLEEDSHRPGNMQKKMPFWNLNYTHILANKVFARIQELSKTNWTEPTHLFSQTLNKSSQIVHLLWGKLLKMDQLLLLSELEVECSEITPTVLSILLHAILLSQSTNMITESSLSVTVRPF